MARPFLCKCGNWHIQVPVFDEKTREVLTCPLCAENIHTPHTKTGVIDCHFGFMSATISEREMGEALLAAQKAAASGKSAIAAIGRATTQESVTAAQTAFEMALAQATLAVAKVPEAIRWAGIFEMPGYKGEAANKRYQTLDQMQLLVNENRRPPEDLAELRRSVKTCNDMAPEVSAAMSEAQAVASQVRSAAASWQAAPVQAAQLAAAPVASAPAARVRSEAEKQKAKERMARVRAGRQQAAPVTA